MSRYVEFVGSCHPTGRDDATYNGHHFTKGEIKRHTQHIIGKPVWFSGKRGTEHDSDAASPVGEIIEAWVGDDGEFLVRGRIDRTKLGGDAAVERIRAGDLRDLSLGTLDMKIRTSQSINIAAKHIEHVALVPEGDRPDTHIDYIEPDSERWILSTALIKESLRTQKLEQEVRRKAAELRQTATELMAGAPDLAASAAAAAVATPVTPVTPGLGDAAAAQQQAAQAQAQAQPPVQTQPPATQGQPPADGQPQQKTVTEMTEELRAAAADRNNLAAVLKSFPELESLLKDNPEQIGALLKSAADKKVNDEETARELRRSAFAKMTADYEATGRKPDTWLSEAYAAAETDPAKAELLAPITDYVASAAGADATKRASDFETLLKEERSELNMVKNDLNEAKAAMQDLIDHAPGTDRAADYRRYVGQQETRDGKRKFDSNAQSAQGSAPVKAAKQEQPQGHGVGGAPLALAPGESAPRLGFEYGRFKEIVGPVAAPQFGNSSQFADPDAAEGLLWDMLRSVRGTAGT